MACVCEYSSPMLTAIDLYRSTPMHSTTTPAYASKSPNTSSQPSLEEPPTSAKNPPVRQSRQPLTSTRRIMRIMRFWGGNIPSRVFR